MDQFLEVWVPESCNWVVRYLSWAPSYLGTYLGTWAAYHNLACALDLNHKLPWVAAIRLRRTPDTFIIAGSGFMINLQTVHVK